MFVWTGRDDGQGVEHARVFKCVRLDSRIGLVGFCSDMGVERNQGRIGAKDAPDVIRKALSNFSVLDTFSFRDWGNSVGDCLETQSQEMMRFLEQRLEKNEKFLILGGGHESSLAPIKAALNHTKSVGVINFDAHFDMRQQDLHTSGNSFYLAFSHAHDIHAHYEYLCIGANALSNTRALFDAMCATQASYILDKDIHKPMSKELLTNFLKRHENIYLSIDVDVFAAHLAPGVSAPAVYGLDVHSVEEYLAIIFDSQKLMLADICEYNPRYDVDNKTARLCALFAYQILKHLGEIA